jgi:hypothetical protein
MLNQIRKELLNLSLSNNLLKLRDFKAKGLDLIGIKSNLIFNYLIEELCNFYSMNDNDTKDKLKSFWDLVGVLRKERLGN